MIDSVPAFVERFL